MNKRLKILLNHSIIIFSFSASIKIYYFDLALSLNLILVDNFNVLFIILNLQIFYNKLSIIDLILPINSYIGI